MLIDIHCHSRHTRGCELEPEAVARRALEVRLDGICFTDVNILEDVAELDALRAKVPIKIFAGLDAATDHGHYLCFFPEPAKVPAPAQMWGGQSDRPWPAKEVVDKVRSMGGAVIAAHPYDRESQFPAGDFIFTLQGLSAVEAFNARLSAAANEMAMEAADHLQLPSVGGSNTRQNLDLLGRMATLFKRPVSNEAELVTALINGEVWPVVVAPPPLPERSRSDRDGPRRHREGGPRGDGERRDRRPRRR
jgi:predicted metal-dependent phosphoesterase TrpH